MFAAVVESFDRPPRYAQLELPTPGPHEAVVDVLAVGLHPRVRSQANGSHYTSTDELPLVPGVDGVGRLADGSLVYFILHDTRFGSMSEQAVIDLRRSIPLPADVDIDVVAAAMNPAMSSWLGFRRRATLRPGLSVLILGATGNAGRMAVQIAKYLGAGHVVAAGRDEARLQELPGLGADATVSLRGEPEAIAARLAAAAADVDIVIDYLWGEPAVRAMVALVTAREDRSASLDWVQIGSVAGATAAVPSAALRAANLRIMGSGQGSVSTAGILEELPALADRISSGAVAVEVEAVPLADVEAVWTAPRSGPPVVLKPWRSAPQEAEPDLPGAVVDVRVDQHDALPDAERGTTVDDRDGHRRRDESGQDVVPAMPRRAAPVAVAVVGGEQPVDRAGQVALGAGSRLHQRDTGGRVRHEHVEQAVSLCAAEGCDVAGQVGDQRVAGPDGQLGGVHGSSMPGPAS